ncbi:MAG: hypothetical protein MUF87_10175 [Anaerolineae bacterium]|nr:hypothetical protein [Anaerolineae bacterium]
MNLHAYLIAAISVRAVDPYRSLALLREGRKMVLEQGDTPCLLMNYERWIVNIEMFYAGDFRAALDTVVRAAVEIRKPRYDHCPERDSILYLLINAYLFFDPVGYEHEIHEALHEFALMESALPTDLWCLVKCVEAYFALHLDRLDDALQLTQVYLGRSEQVKSAFRIVDAYLLLCALYYHRGEHDRIEEAARLGESHALFAPDTQRALAEFAAWQAYTALRRGSEDASSHYRQALQRFGQLKLYRWFAFYDALSAYHEHLGDFDEALRLRDEELSQAITGNSPYIIARTHLQRLELLRKSGASDTEIATAVHAIRTAAQDLRQPQYIYRQLP